jgi:hypothetical protein
MELLFLTLVPLYADYVSTVHIHGTSRVVPLYIQISNLVMFLASSRQQYMEYILWKSDCVRVPKYHSP